MGAMTRNFSHLLSPGERTASEVPVGGARSIVSLLVASYGWDLIVELLLTPWLSASRASEPPP